MLDHTKQYAKKIHSIDAEQAGNVHKLDLKLRSLCVSGFSLFAAPMFTKPCHFGFHLPTTLSKTKVGYIFLSSILNSTIGITSYYCVILKMVILHDAM